MNAIIPEGFDDLKAGDMNGIIDEMVSLLVRAGKIAPETEKTVSEALKQREHLASTSMLNGVAIPHVRNACIQGLICALGRSRKGVNYDDTGRSNTHLFFLVLSSKEMTTEHLECLAMISHAVRDNRTMLEMICEQDKKKLERLLSEL